MMNGKMRKKWQMLLWTGILIAGLFFPSIISEAAKTGSIKVIAHGKTNQEQEVVLDHAKFVCYRVGEIKNGKWTTTGAFQNAPVSLGQEASSARGEQAKQLYQYALQKEIKGKTFETNSKGIAQVTGLQKAIYLIGQTEDWERKGAGAFRSAPFFVPVPIIDGNGTSIYDVVVHPKNEWIDNGEPDGGETIPPDTDVPGKDEGAKTGDRFLVEVWINVMGLSALLLLFLSYQNRKKEQW